MGKRARTAVLLGFLGVGCYGQPRPLAVNGEDNGKSLDLVMNQEVDLTLQTIGPGAFGSPTLSSPSASSPAVDFEGTHFSRSPNPGGPTQIYEFRAVRDGTTQITIPHSTEKPPFTLTLTCCAQ